MKFEPEPRRDKEGQLRTLNVPVVLRINHKGKRLNYTVGVRVDVEKWDYDFQRCKPNTKHNGILAKGINEKIDNAAGVVNNYYNECDRDKKPINLTEIKERLDVICKHKFEEITPEIQPTIEELFAKFIAVSGASIYEEGLKIWSKGLEKHFQVLKSQYIKMVGEKAIASDINPHTFKNFRQWLDNGNYKTKNCNMAGYRNTTMEKKLSQLKWFFRWLGERGYIAPEKMEEINKVDFTLNGINEKDRIKQNIVALTLDEYKKIRDCKIPESKQYLVRVRDVFIFGCHTGLRHSDLQNLKKYDVNHTNKSISITTQKTKTAIDVPLSDRAYKILKKYEKTPDLQALPVPSNQKMNEYLKELAALAKIESTVKKTHFIKGKQVDEISEKSNFITSHTARKTFVLLAIHLGWSAEEVMEITGWSDYEMFKIYFRVQSKTLTNKMKKFNNI